VDDGSILALDVGEARIGLAQWDAARGVREAGVLRRSSLREDLARLGQVARERGATRLVVGLPRNLDGSEGMQARRARRFAAALAKALALPVALWDEYATSQQATAELGLAGRPLSAREHGQVDARAAALILERYLAARQAAQEP
jgi:putative Holliday junction resolvase